MADFESPREVPHGLRRENRVEKVATLRRALEADEPLVLPGVADGLMARLVEQSGFDACYLTGAGVANLEYGLPDVGLIGLGEMTEQLRKVTGATSLPVVADADTGYGGPLSVMRTMHEFEQGGVAGIQFEDQEIPKRCGHFDNKRVIPAEDMVSKILAACAARTEDTVLIARTDCLAVDGVSAAIDRAKLYRRAGADVLFVEAPQSVAQLEHIGRELAGTPLIVNVVEGAKTPELTADRLFELGFQVVLFANFLLRVAARAALDGLDVLRKKGSTAELSDRMITWGQRQSLVGLERADDLGDAFDASAYRLAHKEGHER